MAMPQPPAPEPKDPGPLSLIRPLGQSIFTLVCAKLHRLLWCMPTIIPWVQVTQVPVLCVPWDWKRFWAHACTPFCWSWGTAGCCLTVLSGVIALRAVAGSWMHMFHHSQGMAKGPHILVLFKVLRQSEVTDWPSSQFLQTKLKVLWWACWL